MYEGGRWKALVRGHGGEGGCRLVLVVNLYDGGGLGGYCSTAAVGP